MGDKPEVKPILVVEDISEISSQMGAMLTNKGHRVTYATDAESAIRMAENDRPSLVLSDLELPTFDALISLIRRHADLKGMRVIILDLNDSNPIVRSNVAAISTLAQLDDLLAATRLNSNERFNSTTSYRRPR